MLTRILTGLAAAGLCSMALGGPPAQAAPTLAISPDTTVVGVNGTNRFLAVYDADGPGPGLPVYLDGGEVSWWSSDFDVFTVDDTGLGFGKAPGSAVLSARLGTLTATAVVVVAGEVMSRTLTAPDGRERTYLLYVPEGYAGDPTPLVLAFHGGGGNGAALMHASQLNSIAHAKTFLVAYPDGTDAPGGQALSWNGGGCCGYAADNGVDDVGFARALVAAIDAEFNVNPRRVFATGFSNGAALVHRLGFEAADVIAAIAPLSGAIKTGGDFTAKRPKRAVSVMAFHGTTDQDAPYKGAQASTTWWLFRNRIALASKVVSYQNGIETCESWGNANAVVTLCTARPPAPITVDGVVVDGGGHAWPGGVKSNVSWADYPTGDLNASAAMWEFFKKHPMP